MQEQNSKNDWFWTGFGVTLVMVAMILLSWATVYMVISEVIKNAAMSFGASLE